MNEDKPPLNMGIRAGVIFALSALAKRVKECWVLWGVCAGIPFTRSTVSGRLYTIFIDIPREE